MELIFWASGIYVGGIVLFFGTWLAPTLVAIALKRESVFWILAVNIVPGLVGHGVVGWMIAMAWAAFGRRRQQGTGATKAWWDVLP